MVSCWMIGRIVDLTYQKEVTGQIRSALSLSMVSHLSAEL